MPQIMDLIQSLLGGGSGNSMFMLVIGAIIFFITSMKKPTPPTPPAPKSSDDLLRQFMTAASGSPHGVLGDGKLLKWFLSLPAESQAAFFPIVFDMLSGK